MVVVWCGGGVLVCAWWRSWCAWSVHERLYFQVRVAVRGLEDFIVYFSGVAQHKALIACAAHDCVSWV